MRWMVLTADGFKRWRESIAMTQAECAEALGVSKSTVALYEKGSRAEGDVEISKTVALACMAITREMPPLTDDWAIENIRVKIDVRNTIVDGAFKSQILDWCATNLLAPIVVIDGMATFFRRSDALSFVMTWMFDDNAKNSGLSRLEYIRAIVREADSEGSGSKNS